MSNGVWDADRWAVGWWRIEEEVLWSGETMCQKKAKSSNEST
jgi:hypothetical protein